MDILTFTNKLQHTVNAERAARRVEAEYRARIARIDAAAIARDASFVAQESYNEAIRTSSCPSAEFENFNHIAHLLNIIFYHSLPNAHSRTGILAREKAKFDSQYLAYEVIKAAVVAAESAAGAYFSLFFFLFLFNTCIPILYFINSESTKSSRKS